MTMATDFISSHAHPLPRIRRLALSDLKAALMDGLDDFRAMPTHALFVVVIYPITGLLIGAATLNAELIPLLFPLASGFALVGPFAALGLYEMSRRREQGLDPSWMHAYGALQTPSAGAILSVGLLLAAILLAWLVSALGLHWALFGDRAHSSVSAFAQEVLTTERGWTMIIVGNLAGFAFSLLALAVSVISLPMLVDRHVDALTAVRTSMAVVQKNPDTMLAWGFIVAGLLVIGMLPLFVGLAVVLPILGHATWHLYRRAVT
ncbi:DUF2189 domain-containing protein [Methylobacterium gnaphalii]|uniref:Cytochrome c oxidase subunit I n=1 Tax=Methylobacterium gnaphalii TaxID=1010610 RepID=A0A512JGR9_9HYPH|nr:DUF2189 domain-containing protein [Methylobacterium gnaphalii]GEP09042.1 hypothetical protein MGN01_08870 [Methylobacterium gnaphalii]GJD68353.1 hypothetical protein MMMDOFMJ_1276 [Methylobacterium gnaphalii]GLS48966.1 hypothetical protein GCM10007885_18130 [Methylobacterium gnaphalii]